LFRAIGDKAGQAVALSAVGWYHDLLGDYQQARVLPSGTHPERGNRQPQDRGSSLGQPGVRRAPLGNLAEAAACSQHAVSLFRESGDRFNEADVLTHLGDTRHADGELTQAREAWQQALAILEDLEHPDADQVRAKLASIPLDA
jgi:hypothetical protein